MLRARVTTSDRMSALTGRSTWRAGVLVGVALVTAFGASAVAQNPPPGQNPRQQCTVATDESYGYVAEQPIAVGGSPMYGAARQRRYLQSIRGPEGQPIQFKRLGQRKAPDDTILDAYEVTYEGLDKPITLLLDWYHYDQPKAPRGFTCGQPFNLWPPPVNPFQETDDLVALAFEQGSSREFEPIPLASDGTTYGAVFDRFRLLALAARAAAAKNVTLSPQAPPRETMQQGMLVVAYPRACDDGAVNPSAIDMVAPNGAVMPKRDELVLADRQAIAPYLPGVELPEGSIALRVPSTPRGNDTVRIRYAEPCGDLGTETTIPLTVTPARALEMPRGTAPDGTASDTAVLLQALIDFDGRFTRPSYVGGPRTLEQAATETLAGWRAEPARVNGAPTSAAVVVEVRLDPPRQP